MARVSFGITVDGEKAGLSGWKCPREETCTLSVSFCPGKPGTVELSGIEGGSAYFVRGLVRDTLGRFAAERAVRVSAECPSGTPLAYEQVLLPLKRGLMALKPHAKG